MFTSYVQTVLLLQPHKPEVFATAYVKVLMYNCLIMYTLLTRRGHLSNYQVTHLPTHSLISVSLRCRVFTLQLSSEFFSRASAILWLVQMACWLYTYGAEHNGSLWTTSIRRHNIWPTYCFSAVDLCRYTVRL